MAQGQCPLCNTPNEYTETLCNMCGQRLPWASAVQTAQATVTVRPAPVATPGNILKYDSNPDESRKKAGLCALGCLAPLVIIAAISISGTPSHNTSAPTSEAATFDVPSLFGKNVDEIKAVLGPAAEDTEMIFPGGDDVNDKAWNRGNKTLQVSFHMNTRQVIDFFIDCDSPSGACDDQQHILQIGNVNESDSRYSVSFVPAGGHPGEYTGVTITPK